MASKNDFWYRQLFRNRLHRTTGDAFQLLVSEIYRYREPDFQFIAPWGNWGDGGNDGWIPGKGHYLQLYGPKPTTVLDPVSALGKALTDFNKLTTTGKWLDVRRFSFVLNDHFHGVPAPLVSELQKLKQAKSLEEAGCVGAGQLEQMFMQLSDDLREMIVGGIPSDQPTFISANAVGELLAGLADRAGEPARLFSGEVAPSFEEKLRFNGLGAYVQQTLKLGSYHVHTVDALLDGRDPGLKQAIAREVRELYEQSKTAISGEGGDVPDRRFAWLTDALVPEIAGRHPHSMRAYRDAAQIVLAKYFETCDVYDAPIKHSSE